MSLHQVRCVSSCLFNDRVLLPTDPIHCILRRPVPPPVSRIQQPFPNRKFHSANSRKNDSNTTPFFRAAPSGGFTMLRFGLRTLGTSLRSYRFVLRYPIKLHTSHRPSVSAYLCAFAPLREDILKQLTFPPVQGSSVAKTTTDPTCPLSSHTELSE